MGNLFRSDGMLMRAMSDLMSLVIVNVLTLIFSIPIITAGASLSAMHYVLYQMAENGEGKIAATFFREFKNNLKNATPIALIFYVLLGIGFLDYRIFSGAGGIGDVVLITLYAGAMILMCLFVWVFPLTAKFVYSTGGAFKNAMILSATHLPRTLLMIVIMVVIPFILTQDMRLLPLAFLLGISFPSYLCTLLYSPVLKKMM